MGPFLPLFSIEVEHGFFPGNVCRGLHFVPTPDSAAKLARARCLLRPTEAGALVLYDATATSLLQALAADADEPFCLDFLVRTDDALFANYTDGLSSTVPSLPMFDSTQAVAEGNRWRLHAGTTAGPNDLQCLDGPRAAELLAQRERLARPAFTVSITVTAADVAADAPPGKRYFCCLQARTTVWKYCLFGAWSEDPADPVQVVDLAQAWRFEAAVAERLADGQDVLAVRSSTRIPLQQRSDRRFQLRQRSGSTERVLVKRLPVATARQLSRETLGGEPTLVSEIYVHR
jgi:hypothetical protein